MGYDRGDSFPFDFEPNEVPFGTKLKGKLSPRSYPFQRERKWNASFLSVLPDPPVKMLAIFCLPNTLLLDALLPGNTSRYFMEIYVVNSRIYSMISGWTGLELLSL